jgi:transposase-like protein
MEQRRKLSRRSFSDNYKEEVVELCRISDRAISEVTRDLDLTVTAMRPWVAQADIDEHRRSGTTPASTKIWSSSEKGNRVLRECREI